MMSNVTPIRTPAETTLIDAYAAARSHLPGGKAVTALREQAFAGFAATGLPHRRVEAWKYTDWRTILRESAPLAGKPDLATIRRAIAQPAALSAPEAVTITLVNGHLAELSGTVPAGLTITPLAEALAAGHPDLARMGMMEIAADNVALRLNTAFMGDGAVVHVAPGAVIDVPLVIRCITDDEVALSTMVRVLVLVGAGASCLVVESQETRGAAHQPNTAVEILLGDDAKVSHLRGAAHDQDAIVLASLIADLGARAELTSVSVITTGAAVRQQAFTRFGGADARMTLNGGSLAKGKQHQDSTLVADHAEPGGISRELFRTAIDENATGVFQGKIMVRQKAQQTDGRMASNAVLLGEGCTMNNKPELEIFADDVQCAHGATCGALDDDLLFYLMARGLPRSEAEALMIESFVGEVLEPVTHEGLREMLVTQIEGWLATRGAAA
jgi:Fe-S cluster assembly protein SufD